MNYQSNEETVFNSPFEPVKNAKYYRKTGWKKLSPHWGWGVLNRAILFAAAFVISTLTALPAIFLIGGPYVAMIFSGLAQNDIAVLVSTILFVVGWVVYMLLAVALGGFLSVPLQLGYRRSLLGLIDGDEARIKPISLLYFFKHHYFKAVRHGLLNTAITFGTAVPMLILAIAGGVLAGIGESYAIPALPIIGLILAVVGYLSYFCLLFPVSYGIGMSSFILVDYPEVSVTEALRASWSMMRGKKWKLFCLDISFIGWILLFSLLGDYGAILLDPYRYTAIAEFYHDVSNRRAGEDAEFPSLDPDDYAGKSEL